MPKTWFADEQDLNRYANEIIDTDQNTVLVWRMSSEERKIIWSFVKWQNFTKTKTEIVSTL